MFRLLSAIVICFAVLVPAARSQGDLPSKMASLQGIDSFVVDVTLEGPGHLVQSDPLRSEVVSHRIVNRLREAGLGVQRVRTEQTREPNFHIHINVLQLEGGLIPFSIDAGFYQEVRLASSGRSMAAPTWGESVLGMVSADLVGTIPQSVDSLVDQFIEDFQAVND